MRRVHYVPRSAWYAACEERAESMADDMHTGNCSIASCLEPHKHDAEMLDTRMVEAISGTREEAWLQVGPPELYGLVR